MPSRLDNDLVDKLTEVQRLLGQLESIICQQSGDVIGDFGILVKEGKVKPSKFENRARMVGQRAREACSDRQAAQKVQEGLKARIEGLRKGQGRSKARDDIIAGVQDELTNGPSRADHADSNACEEVYRAINLLNEAIKRRATSYSRKAQALQPQELTPQRSRKSQAAVDLEARQAQALTDLQARQARELANLQAREEQRGEDTPPQPLVEDPVANQVTGYFNLTSEDVSLAIASLAVGIARNDGPTIAVAQDELQQAARSEEGEKFWTCLCRPGQFILPLLMEGGTATGEKSLGERLSAVGHLVLVVAERTGDDIHLKLSDSLTRGSSSDATIQKIAWSIVENSGWMDGRTPRFVRAWHNEVPQQMPGTNSCGLHVILSGWAYLLNIKVNAQWSPTDALYRSAVVLVNQALRGQSTATEIRAWMMDNAYAQASDEAADDNAALALMGAHTARLNPAIYQDYLAEARQIEIASTTAANSATDTTSAAATTSATAPPPTVLQHRKSPPPPASPHYRTHVSNSMSSEDDDDNDDNDDDDDDPPRGPVTRSRTNRVKATRKASPAASPPPTKRQKPSQVITTLKSAMTFEERKTALNLLTLKRLRQVVIMPSKARKQNAINLIANSDTRVPLEALDIWEKKRLPGYNEVTMRRWRESEKPPPLPSRDAMTDDQKREAFRGFPWNSLQRYMRGMPNASSKSTKSALVQHAIDLGLEVPERAYDMWAGTVAYTDRKRYVIVTVREVSKWILSVMESQEDVAYNTFIEQLRNATTDESRLKKDLLVDLHPPGFEKKAFPCVMYRGGNSKVLRFSLSPTNELATSACARFPGEKTQASVIFTLFVAHLILNNDKRSLQLLWENRFEVSHLCHSKSILERIEIKIT